MKFKEYLKEKEDELFPSDDQIESVVEDANEEFWKTVIGAFEDKLESKDFNKESFIAVLEPFKKMQKEAVKEWLKSNWPEIDSTPKEEKATIPTPSSNTPATNKPAAGEARMTGI